ncbi:MAG: hypothetical protein JF615_01095 [Asticcacaulis sp.]|nr:hypothetical protein [Asticcacaulis sp.]
MDKFQKTDGLLAIIVGVAAGVITLFIWIAALSAASLADPQPNIRAALAHGEIMADEDMAAPWQQLGRVHTDCEIAGHFVPRDKGMGTFLFGPTVPKDVEGVLSSCQAVRDVMAGGSSITTSFRAVSANAIGLRTVDRLLLAVMPMWGFQACLVVLNLALAILAAFVLVRRGQLSTMKGLLLGAVALMGSLFSSSLSIGPGALLWTMAVAAFFLVDLDRPGRTAVTAAALGGLSAIFDYESGLVVSVLIAALFAVAAREASRKRFAQVLIAYLVAALVVTLVLALAQVIMMKLDSMAAEQQFMDRFGDLGQVSSAGNGQSGGLLPGWLQSMLTTNGQWFGLGIYVIICLIGFGAWALNNAGRMRTSDAVLVGSGLAIGWAIVIFQRFLAHPQEYLSVPLLLIVCTVAALIVLFVPRTAVKLESAS